jgi:glutathione peroxidase
MSNRVSGLLSSLLPRARLWKPAATSSAYAFSFPALDGGSLPLSSFEGKPILVVNTASYCGFTSQYAELQQLWRRFHDDGLVVLGVPSNDFGQQEPDTEEEIARFCTSRFAVDFPMAAKTAVKGGDRHPFYAWAAAELGPVAAPRWNFHKYLVGRQGELRDWFSSMTTPASPRVVRAIETALAQRV